MTFWVPRPEHLIGAVLALAGLAVATPASALPLVDLGANVGVAGHLASGGPAVDLTGEANIFGWMVSAQYWNQFATTPNTYLAAALRKNVSPVPMLSVAPGIGVASWNGAAGPQVNLTGTFSPFLLPVSLEAQAGAAYLLNGSTLFPYYVGAKASLIPFTAFALRYRGWAGAMNVSGPEIGIEIGI